MEFQVVHCFSDSASAVRPPHVGNSGNIMVPPTTAGLMVGQPASHSGQGYLALV